MISAAAGRSPAAQKRRIRGVGALGEGIVGHHQRPGRECSRHLRENQTTRFSLWALANHARCPRSGPAHADAGPRGCLDRHRSQGYGVGGGPRRGKLPGLFAPSPIARNFSGIARARSNWPGRQAGLANPNTNSSSATPRCWCCNHPVEEAQVEGWLRRATSWAWAPLNPSGAAWSIGAVCPSVPCGDG